jgi:hypothetical protein
MAPIIYDASPPPTNLENRELLPPVVAAVLPTKKKYQIINQFVYIILNIIIMSLNHF